MQLACGVGNHLLDFDRCLGAFTLQLSSDVVRCLGNQLLEDMPGDVDPVAERLDEDGITLGSFDHAQEAEIRESRAGIIGQRSNDVLIAGDDENVGHGLGDGFPLDHRRWKGDRDQKAGLG